MSVDQGGQPTEEIMRWKHQLFSPVMNELIREIVQLGGEADLVRVFDQFRKEFEPALQQVRNRLMAVAMDRGLEP